MTRNQGSTSASRFRWMHLVDDVDSDTLSLCFQDFTVLVLSNAAHVNGGSRPFEHPLKEEKL